MMNIQTYSLQSSVKKQPYLETCSICCQQKLRGKQQIDYLRLVEICYQCWFNHIKSYITRISYRAGDIILSPFSQGQPIGIVQCINSLRRNDAIQIEEIVYKKYTAFTKDVQKCPSQSCDFVYIGDKCKWNSKQNVYNCPKCQMPLVQQKKLSFKSLMASFYLMMANKCPKCDIPIQKISGCPHMTCPCGHHFCWYCYKDHPSGTLKRVYHLHNIPQCAFIFISKIVLFLLCFVCLLVTFNGNWVIRYIFSIAKTIFWVIARAAVLDGFILAQIMYFMMKKRRRLSRVGNNVMKQLLIVGCINLCGISLLYWFGQITAFIQILIGQLALACLGFGIGYSVIFSIQTWFEFIA